MRRGIYGIGVATLVFAVLAAGAFAAPGRRVATLSGQGFPGGDPNARGRAVLWVNPAQEKICFRIRFRRLIKPNYGSIHRGPRSSDGPLEVTLFNGDRGMRSSPIKGCARDLPREVVREIKRHPRRFYVELDQHTYANSTVRGRIRRPN